MSEETRKKEHPEKNLEKLTIKELREIAAEFPHERAILDMDKDELVVFIKEARGIKDEAPAKKRKRTIRMNMTKPELKAKIRELKALRADAQASHDTEKDVMLRHQISQLKKKSRRLAAD